MKLTKYWVALFLVMAVVFAGGLPGAPALAAVTKIVPTDGAEPGEPFTIIDTPEGRLVDGSVAVFRLNGGEVIIPLRTHKPYNTAHGILPADMRVGVYTVSVRQPGGTEFAVGPFTVIGLVVRPPFLDPDHGPPGTVFRIIDDEGRLGLAADIRFAEPGWTPESGAQAPVNVIDAYTVESVVPARLPAGYRNVTVHIEDASTPSPPIFGLLVFTVE